MFFLYCKFNQMNKRQATSIVAQCAVNMFLSIDFKYLIKCKDVSDAEYIPISLHIDN